MATTINISHSGSIYQLMMQVQDNREWLMRKAFWWKSFQWWFSACCSLGVIKKLTKSLLSNLLLNYYHASSIKAYILGSFCQFSHVTQTARHRTFATKIKPRRSCWRIFWKGETVLSYWGAAMVLLPLALPHRGQAVCNTGRRLSATIVHILPIVINIIISIIIGNIKWI